MNRKPLILCTRSYIDDSKILRVGLNKSYADAIEKSGGILLMVTSGISTDDIDSLLNQVDGILVPGGADLNPSIYNEVKKEYTQKSDDERDELEQNIVKIAIQKRIPILAICRGCQILNVSLGGSLYQDIEQEKPDHIKHDYHHDGPRSLIAHSVSLTDGSLISKILNTKEAEANSLHHQGIKELGNGLMSAAVAPDNLIEAIELTDYPFGIGLQWHPEDLENPIWKKLFDAFVEVCESEKIAN